MESFIKLEVVLQIQSIMGTILLSILAEPETLILFI